MSVHGHVPVVMLIRCSDTALLAIDAVCMCWLLSGHAADITLLWCCRVWPGGLLCQLAFCQANRNTLAQYRPQVSHVPDASPCFISLNISQLVPGTSFVCLVLGWKPFTACAVATAEHVMFTNCGKYSSHRSQSVVNVVINLQPCPLKLTLTSSTSRAIFHIHQYSEYVLT